MSVRDAIRAVSERRDLDDALARAAIGQIMNGEATDAQVAGLLMGLRLKGERPREVAAMAEAMMERAVTIASPPGGSIDTCGTGGDGASTFNISTAVAFVCAAAGLTVAKHGNRSVSSSSGSADVLEALGARVDMEPSRAEAVLRELGVTFLFAPLYHPGMKHAAGARRDLGVRTIFNLLGPILNPARAPYRCVGVAAPEHLELVLGALVRLGVRRALVYHAGDGLDEFSLESPTSVLELRDGAVERYEITHREFGLARVPVSSIQVANPTESARLVLSALGGEAGAPRDYVCANAGAALYLAGAAGSYRGGVELAKSVIDSGAALAKLRAFVAATGGNREFS